MLSEAKKKEITKKFLIKIARYAYNDLKTGKRKFIRYCFKQITNNHKVLHTIYKNLRVNYKFKNDIGANAYTNVYKELSTFYYSGLNPYYFDPIIDSFMNKILRITSDDYFNKMNKITNNFDEVVDLYYRKINYGIGIICILAILLISLIIPNHAINLTGITFDNLFIYISHFLLIQFRNLINPALIGRLLINVIGDVYVTKYYLLNKK